MKKIILLIILAFHFSIAGFSQDTLNHYSDAEVLKLVSYIKNLEGKTADYLVAHPNEAFVNDPSHSAEEKKDLNDLLNDSTHRYNDVQIIKLAKYIKHLERIESLNAIALADAKKKHDDSLANVLTIKDQKLIDKFEKSIFFNFDSYTLKPESHIALDEAVKILKSEKDVVFVIEGHTDNVGGDAYNLNLSKERAKTVMNYFISKGIPADKISSVGYGEEKPIASNDTEEGRAKNRRVEISTKKK